MPLMPLLMDCTTVILLIIPWARDWIADVPLHVSVKPVGHINVNSYILDA